MSIFGAEPGADHSDPVEFANRVNLEYVVVRASISEKDSIFFEYAIPVGGGITKKAVILATKRFLSIPVQSIVEHGKDIIKW
ncbi:MAG: YbjN domain-containing protein [Planctomycetes bacterium]|nr:YbjN domain-containing protein [Planctomycetota bacterium]